jgi:hypothetical protein
MSWPNDYGALEKHMETRGMSHEKTEMEKLRMLLDHWIEHNHEHAETYMQWAEKAGASGNSKLSGMLKEIAAEAKKMDVLFEKARQEIS